MICESRPEDLAAACGAVSDRWIDGGKSAELEQMDYRLSRQFWNEVGALLASRT